MDIGIIGTGSVGGTLGVRWAQGGHTVRFGSRDPESDKVKALLAKAGDGAEAMTAAQAARSSKIVLLATPWPATEAAIMSLGDLSGKTIIDCTNPLTEDLSGLTVGHSDSAAEQVAKWAVGANVIKAFNMTGSGNMANPTYGDQQAAMFICGDDDEAKRTVMQLSEELGFTAVDSGMLSSARYLEPMAMLWIHLAYAKGMGPDIAFALLKR